MASCGCAPVIVSSLVVMLGAVGAAYWGTVRAVRAVARHYHRIQAAEAAAARPQDGTAILDACRALEHAAGSLETSLRRCGAGETAP